MGADNRLYYGGNLEILRPCYIVHRAVASGMTTEYLWRGWEQWVWTGAIAALPWWTFSSIPYWTARVRNVGSSAGVRVIGLLAILLEGLPALFVMEIGGLWMLGPAVGLVLWLLALVWAISGSPRTRPQRYYSGPAVAYETAEPAAPFVEAEAAVDGPGMFRVSGVYRESRMDTVWDCASDSEANARVKAELEGIIVTRVDRID